MPSKRKAGSLAKAQGSEKGNRVKKRRWGKRLDPSNVYVASGKQAEEDKNPYKFDWAPEEEDLFKINSDFEDEEINEDEAFGEEDEEKFGDWFASEGNIDGVDEDGDEDFDEIDELMLMEEDVNADSEEELDTDDAQIEQGQLKSLAQSVADVGMKSQKHTGDDVATEVVQESMLNIGSSRPGKSGDLTLGDLMATLKSNRENAGATQWALERLTDAAPVSVPMPRTIRERQERKAGYDTAKAEMVKWKDIIKANRQAPTIEFAPQTLNLRNSKLTDMVADFEPKGGLEEELNALLVEAGAAATEDIEKSEDSLAMKALSVEQLKERRERLRSMRSMLFYHEIKAKRMSSIKSKEYHRRLQRSIKNKSVKFSDLPDDEAARKLAEEMEYKRAEERMTQRHSTKTRWAKRIMRRGLNIQDEETREALNEQLRQGQELKKKIEKIDAKDGSDSDTDASAPDDEENENGHVDYKKTHKAALELLEGNALEENIPEKGLFALPFIRKSMDRRRQRAKAEAEEVLAELEGVTPEENEGDSHSGRLEFSGKTLQQVQGATDSDDEQVLDPKADEAYVLPTKRLESLTENKSVQPLQGQRVVQLTHMNSKSPSAVKLPLHSDSTGGVASRSYLFEAKGGARQEKGDQPKQEKQKSMESEKQSTAASQSISEVEIDDELVEILDEDSDVKTPTQNTRVPVASNKGAVPVAQGKNVTKPSSQKSQAELIDMAFAGDDVGTEFAAEKKQEVQKDLGPELEVNILPGWGTWKSQQREPSWMAEDRYKDKKKREAAAASRQDAGLKHVIISEKAPASLSAFTVDRLPQPYRNVETYEMHMRHPLGKEFNPHSSVVEFTRPSVMKTSGVIIDPLRYSEPLQETVNDTISNFHRSDIKVSKIVSGTVKKYMKTAGAEAQGKTRDSKMGRKYTSKRKNGGFEKGSGNVSKVRV